MPNYQLPITHYLRRRATIPPTLEKMGFPSSFCEYDKQLYKARHLIESFFAKLKQDRAIATRYDNLAETFLSAIYMAAAIIWLN